MILGCSSRSNDLIERSVIEEHKVGIEKSFIENIEYYRVSAVAGERLIDPANFFEPFSVRYNIVKEAYVGSPKATDQQLSVNAEEIIYSNDSLFCLALVILEKKYDSVPELQPLISNRRFSGKAIIGYRSKQGDKFSIYPLSEFSVAGMDSYAKTKSILKDFYFSKLHGTGRSGSIYEGIRFGQNVGDKNFFKKSPYFKRHDSGLYNFQVYRHLGEDKPYEYISNINN